MHVPKVMQLRCPASWARPPRTSSSQRSLALIRPACMRTAKGGAMEAIRKQVILWAQPADLADDAPAFVAYREVAKKFKGQLVFVTVDNEGPTQGPVTKFFGLAGAPSPSVVGFFMDDNKKYKLSEEYNEANLEKFCQGVVDGTAPQEFKSAAVPEKATDDDGVTTVVGKSVDEIVKDPTKDVLLEVYAPWCGHCKALEPTYKKLGKRFKKIDSVVIAKMDGTENEHPDVNASGFPSIFFFPAEKDAKPVSFESGDRSLKTLTKFIKEHAKVPYELPKKPDGEADQRDEL
ncbi:thioredoxin-like protein [Dunaliella salina]|uniref:Thioredoxin-like protein n=1 Tax=Dunaliella salina TaxID=3046 RepID=A0ABQ7GD22_DUNSA|nr:thioredoxin-like protein [Dunaliella salina]|eukprot:KAF5832481.1 thioredoxin-like protein [Dunaliella salina]